MNIKETLNTAFKKIESANIENPAQEAEILLSFVLKKGKEFLFSHPEKKVSFWQNLLFQRIIKKTFSRIF